MIVPTLDAARHLPGCLAAVRTGAPAAEIVVVDGGSSDGTAGLAAGLGARVVVAPRGRGGQLAAGAAATRADWLLFLHADTRLGPGWAAALERLRRRPDAGTRWAAFALALDDPAPAARRLERLVAWRCRALGLPYGDQGLALSRALYERVGGFAPLPLMEDVDIARRLGRRRLVMLDAPALTSAERYRRDGWLRRPARNLACLTLYFLGVAPARIARLYG